MCIFLGLKHFHSFFFVFGCKFSSKKYYTWIFYYYCYSYAFTRVWIDLTPMNSPTHFLVWGHPLDELQAPLPSHLGYLFFFAFRPRGGDENRKVLPTEPSPILQNNLGLDTTMCIQKTSLLLPTKQNSPTDSQKETLACVVAVKTHSGNAFFLLFFNSFIQSKKKGP